MHNKHSRVKKIYLPNGYWIPTAAAVGIIPLITGVYFYTNDVLAGYPWFLPSSYYSSDVFLAYKSFAVQILMAVMIIASVFRVLKTKEKPCVDKSFLLFIPYLFFVVLSGICSKYPALSFGTSYDRFEPVGVVVSYAVICTYSYLFIDSESQLKKVIYLCAVSYALMMIIGLLQGLGADPFNTEFVSRLLTPAGMRDGSGKIAVMRYGKVAYCTLYNENYTGVYLSVMLPVCVMIASLRINKYLRIAAGVLAAVSLFVLYRSGSMSAVIALGVSVFAVFMLRMYRKMGVKALAAAAAVFIAVILAVLIVPALRSRVSEKISGKSRYPYGRIVDMDTKDDEVVFFFYSGNELHCRFDFTDDGEIRPEFWDKEGRTLKTSYSDGVYSLDECFEYAFAAVKGEPTGQPGVYVASFVIDNHQWPVTNCTDGTYYYVTSGLCLVKYPKIISAGLFPDEFLSGRGAIWNRSIPVLKKHFLLGCGSNLFITDYQQDDYVRKTYSVGWGSFEYDVKPHSYYICTWMESGFPALLCIIAFFLYYIIKGARLYVSIDLNDETLMYGSRIGLGMYIGCIAYMIIVAANDSIVCTAPVFWGVLGMSIALNERLNMIKGQDSGKGQRNKRE
ncbi:MAG: O-antigen ligase family protein [Lachnospiraceae bacterium]|nr:O-antigen ligase family protein [Lachnospiraceae bacterium]